MGGRHEEQRRPHEAGPILVISRNHIGLNIDDRYAVSVREPRKPPFLIRIHITPTFKYNRGA
jgi:hypothetical protein